MINLIWIIYLAILLLALGLKFNKLLELKTENMAEKITFSLSLGLGFLSYFTFMVGMLGLLYRWIIYFALVILTFFLISEIKEIIGSIKKAMSGIFRDRIFSNKETLLFSLIILIFAIMNLIEAFAPVINWDSLGYHMAVAKIYIQHHKIHTIAFMPPSNWPAAIDMIYLFGLLVQGDVLSQLFSWLITITLIFTIYSFGARYLSHRIGQLGALVFCSIPLVNTYAAVTYVDLGLTLFIVLAVYSFINWINTNRREWLIVCAIDCGIAAWSKLTGILVIPLFLLGILFLGIKNKYHFKVIIKNIFIVSIISSVIAVPWYVKTWITAGNPIFPHLYNIIGGKNWNMFSDFLYRSLYKEVQVKSFMDFMLLPLNLSLGVFDASIGPLFLVILPLCLIRFKNLDRNIKIISIFVFLYFIICSLITNQPRFFFVVLALSSIIVAYGLDHIWPKGKMFGISIVVLLCTLTFVWSLSEKKYKILTSLGLITKNDFLNRNTPYYEQYQWINKNISSDCKILVWTPFTYYLDKEYVWGSPAIQGLIDFSKIEDSKTLLCRMQELGITHIFHTDNERINFAVMGNFLDDVHLDLLKTGKLILVKKWRTREALSNGKFVDSFLYFVNY